MCVYMCRAYVCVCVCVYVYIYIYIYIYINPKQSINSYNVKNYDTLCLETFIFLFLKLLNY